MEHTKLIEYLTKQIELWINWPLEKGILISGNDAKLIVSTHQKLVDALEKLIHFHACEMEGIESGMPTPSQWMEAVEQAQETLNEITK